MRFGLIASLLGLLMMPSCARQPEPQSVIIEFKIKNLDGQTDRYQKTIPFKDILENSRDIGFYECVVGDNEYRMGFWANLYPPISAPAVDIRYKFGNMAEGVGLAMPEKYFSIYNFHSGSLMKIELWRTSFLETMRGEFPNQFLNNLDCHIVVR